MHVLLLESYVRFVDETRGVVAGPLDDVVDEVREAADTKALERVLRLCIEVLSKLSETSECEGGPISTEASK